MFFFIAYVLTCNVRATTIWPLNIMLSPYPGELFLLYFSSFEAGGGNTCRPVGYERVYLPLCKVADTPFHIQGDDVNMHLINLIYLVN